MLEPQPIHKSDNPGCVGALILNAQGRVFAHRRSLSRRVLPGLWDIVGGHVESGESTHEALAREIIEETGWELRHIEVQIGDWQWEHAGVVRREVDYIVKVNGDLTSPRLEEGKHDAYAWVGFDNLGLIMEGRRDGDCQLCDIIAKALEWVAKDRIHHTPPYERLSRQKDLLPSVSATLKSCQRLTI